MNTSYIKLNAKKHLVKCHFKCFLVSVLPYVTIVLLCVLNYYLYFMLKDINFFFLYLKSSYAIYLRGTLLTLSICLSVFLYKAIKGNSEYYFYRKIQNPNTSVKVSIKGITLRMIFTILVTDILKFFLSVAWSVLYFAPCISVFATLVYYFNKGEVTSNILLTLLISTFILFVIGSIFIYITLKRYSMCHYIIFDTNERDSIAIISKSIDIMNNKLLNFSFYNLSFVGWFLSCFLILPAIYVLPYKQMSKYSYYNFSTRGRVAKKAPQKPIVFYISKRIEES